MAYAAPIALSAFLLFLVQPLIAKQILPWFGGAAAVWTTCMVFFQVVLVAGYAYSDAVTRRLTPRTLAILHVALLAASVLTLPILAPAWLKPAGDAHPSARVLALLAITIGLPYFLLSTTGPLVQAWFARRHEGDRVYRLYALSNAASIAALVAYPVLVEPFVSTRLQAWGWSAGYALFAVLVAAAAIRSSAVASSAPAQIPSTATSQSASGDTAAGDLGALTAAAIFVLAALASALLLAITAHMTRDIASIPFLWTVPLLLYLLTFVLCFDGRGWYRREVFVPAAAVLAIAMLAVNQYRQLDLRLSLPAHALGLFAACMVCHGEIVARRPAARHLTRFYLMVSLGGAAGGLLVGIVAPLVFPAAFELPFALCFVALAIYRAVPGRLRFVGAAALVAASWLTTAWLRDLRINVVDWSRNFYGALRVMRSTEFDTLHTTLQLSHGIILHGEQFIALERRGTPTSYYGATSGVVRALALHRPGPIRVAVIGLGTGTLAAHGLAGDYFKFYELDPAVERYARTHFTFLEDSPAMIDVAIGDARLSLEGEPPQGYDLIAVDAFSSDSIPVHLMTSEAVELYRRHLRARGVIAFHVSNRYLDLAPVIRAIADASGLRTWQIQDEPEDTTALTASDWVLVTGDEGVFEQLRAEGAGEEVTPKPGLRPWTDDYSNLLRIVQFRQEGEER